MTTIHAPCAKGQGIDITGKVMWLLVGERKHRFFAHDGMLTDYRSGYRVGGFRDIQTLRYVANTYARPLSDRDAAQIMLDRILGRLGRTKVEAELAKHPTLNPRKA